MGKPIKASEYLAVGEDVQWLGESRRMTVGAYLQRVQELKARLHQCGFGNAVAAIDAINRYEIPADAKSKFPDPLAVTQFLSVISTARSVLYKEAAERETIALERGNVSDRLRGLPRLLPADKNLTEAQIELMDETIRCIECGAYRAAAVMGWNLVYDYMRRWTTDNNRLGDLNNGLAAICPKKKQISQYEDFFDKYAPNEREIIDAMAHQDSGPIIGGEIRDRLVQKLRDRNKYAHASEKAASSNKTNSYIENLIDIITSAPFA